MFSAVFRCFPTVFQLFSDNVFRLLKSSSSWNKLSMMGPQMKACTLMIQRNSMIPNCSMIPAIRWSLVIRWCPAIRWSIGSMDFDNPKSLRWYLHIWWSCIYWFEGKITRIPDLIQMAPSFFWQKNIYPLSTKCCRPWYEKREIFPSQRGEKREYGSQQQYLKSWSTRKWNTEFTWQKNGRSWAGQY